MSVRTERVARLLQREIADILTRDFEEDRMLTVTGARVSRDLSIAYVSISVMGATPEQRQATFRNVVDRTAAIRGQLARRIRHQIRAIPTLRFFLDESLEITQKMDSLFEHIREEKVAREGNSVTHHTNGRP